MRRHVTAISLVLAACGGPSPPPSPADAATASWHAVLHDLPPTLLCVWGVSPTDVFAVGGPRGDGTTAAILHYDGNAWTNLATGRQNTYWWAHGTSDTDVWAVGEQGAITHWDGTRLTDSTSGTTATLYGVWAAAPNDVWAVGGTPEGGTAKPNDVLLHFDGTRWSPSPLPKTLGRAFFKVWGTSSSNLYVVGELGTIWHRVGTAWSLEADSPPLATGNLTTVNGCSASEVYAVGGRDVLEWDGTGWSRVDVHLQNDVNGVACASPGHVVIVGFGGLKQRLASGVWQDDFMSEPHIDLHGAWADPSGAYWAAGGDFITDPVMGASRRGVIAYYGATAPAGTLNP